jgi:hypothetical protein
MEALGPDRSEFTLQQHLTERRSRRTSLDLFCLFGNRSNHTPKASGRCAFWFDNRGMPTPELSRGTSRSLLFAGRCSFPFTNATSSY